MLKLFNSSIFIFTFVVFGYKTHFEMLVYSYPQSLKNVEFIIFSVFYITAATDSANTGYKCFNQNYIMYVILKV